mmetsp:Transcript_7709/g.13533  ORF Transcript_7709/g.13533 Transcript_7709/m.13533 type:complete len:364 (+) Transcript_7709:191-1282(+)
MGLQVHLYALLAAMLLAFGQADRVKLSPGSTWGNTAYGTKSGGVENGTLGYQIMLVDPDFDGNLIPILKARKNTIVMCYLSVGTIEPYRPYFQSLSPEKLEKWQSLSMGSVKHFDNEMYLDIRQEETLIPLIRERLEILKSQGCDAVEPDNLDCYQAGACAGQWKSWTRRRKLQQSALYAIQIAQMAHELDMAITIKNSLELYAYPGILEVFDGAAVSNCVFYKECDIMRVWDILDKLVMGTEYRNREKSCRPGKYPGNIMMKFCPGNFGRYLCKDRVLAWDNCFERLDGELPDIEVESISENAPDNRAKSEKANSARKAVSKKLKKIIKKQPREKSTVLHPMDPTLRKDVLDRIQEVDQFEA